MANMFSTAQAGKFTDTYARIPFQEIASMGNKLEKKTEKAQEMTSAIAEMMNVDALGDADFQSRKDDMAGFEEGLSGISENHFKDANQAMRDARSLARQVGAWKSTGRGAAMQNSYDSYQKNLKMISSAVASGGLDVDTERRLKREAKEAYQGVGEGGDEGYGTYNQVLPSVIKEGLTDQANNLIKGWNEDGSYKLKKDPATGESYYINESKNRVDEGEVRAALNSGMRNPTNDAWARQSAKTQMSKMNPNQQSFTLPNGEEVNRDQMENMLMENEYNKAIDFAAPKASFDKTKASLNANWILKNQMAASAKAKTAVDAFTTVGGAGTVVDAKDVELLRSSVLDLESSLKAQNKSVSAYKKSRPNASRDPQDDNYDPTYAQMMTNKETSSLQLAEQESYLVKPRAEADKLMVSNTGDFQFLDHAKPEDNDYDRTHTDGAESHNAIYGLTDKLIGLENTGSAKMTAAIDEARSGVPPTKLEKLLQKGVRDNKTFEQVMEENGLPKNILNLYNGSARGLNLLSKYRGAKSSYSDAVEANMKEDTEKVDSYRFVAGIEGGKFASPNAALMKTYEKSVLTTAGTGFSSAVTGGQLDKYMEQEFDSSWSKDYNKWMKEGNISVQQTSGFTSKGKGILNLSITDDDGDQHNIPITPQDNDMYLRTGQEMSRSTSDVTRATGEEMVMNAIPVGTHTLGGIVKGSGMESMFTADGKARANVKAPLYGFKGAGKQWYVEPKSIAGNGLKTYRVVDIDGTVIKETIGGSNDLRKFLHGKLTKANSTNSGWQSKYGLGK